MAVDWLEDRLAPAFLGGVRVGVGDVDGDGNLDIVTGAGPGGGPHVRVVSGRTGGELYSFLAGGTDDRGGVTVAVGDVTGDGAADILTAAPGRAVVRIWDGRSGQPVRSLPAFDAVLAGSLSLAVGDITGDGRPDIVVGAGAGGGPHVKAFDGASGQEVRSFFAYATDFRGGVTVAVGDVTGDGRADIVTGAGVGGGPHVRVFDGRTGADAGSFYAMDPAFTGGLQVAASDVRGLGRADILVGANFGGGPRVQVVDGRTFATVQDFFAYAPDFRGGVYLAAADLTADGQADVVTGPGMGLAAEVRVFSGGRSADQLTSFVAYDPVSAATPFAKASDRTPPNIQLLSPAAGAVVGSSPTFAGRTTDAGSGVAILRAAVDGGSFTDVAFASDGLFTFVPAITADGTHTVRFKATDKSGNATEVTREFRLDSNSNEVDRTRPTVTVTAPTQGQTVAASPTVTGVVADDNSGVALLLAAIDDGAFAAVTFAANGSFRYTPATLAGGPHTVRLKATDGVGNTSDVLSVAFTVQDGLDLPPVVTITAPVPDQVFARNPSVRGVVTDDRPGPLTLEVATDGGAFGPLAVDASGSFQLDPNLPLGGAADGSHTVRLRATDAAGNLSKVATVSFTLMSNTSGVETTPPVVMLAAPPAGSITRFNPTVTGTATDEQSGVALLQAALDAGGFADVPLGANGSFDYTPALPLSGVADGSHTLRFRAIDRAGNISKTVDLGFTLDSTVPTVSVGLSPVRRQSGPGHHHLGQLLPDRQRGAAGRHHPDVADGEVRHLLLRPAAAGQHRGAGGGGRQRGDRPGRVQGGRRRGR